MLRKLWILALTVMVGGSILCRNALGREFPARPIEIVCPYPAGASIDLMSRLAADIASKYLGERVLVINKPGGAGSAAAADVIGSKPDGHRLAAMASFYFGGTAKTQKLPFDPNDLVPLVNLMEFRFGMMVNGDSPWATLGDLLDYARRNPGKLRWGHPGRAVSIYMSALLIFRKAGAVTSEVPYKGSPQVLASLLGGHIEAATGVYGTVKGQVRAGKIRYLTVYSDKRYRDLPDVPSVVELGFPKAAIPSLIGFYVHKDTPKAVKQNLMHVFKRTYEDPEFKKGIERIGEEPKYGGPELMREAIKKSEEVSLPLLKEFGLYAGK
ncbi:MAG: tripartite tricarboxylate transporter substrate binding protein [Deltaproteobacteria bacterium]|nr:tripartite tricarboxylate transporter substrate binding protein [Deltaproteobacteria bacterium]